MCRRVSEENGWNEPILSLPTSILVCGMLTTRCSKSLPVPKTAWRIPAPRRNGWWNPRPQAVTLLTTWTRTGRGQFIATKKSSSIFPTLVAKTTSTMTRCLPTQGPITWPHFFSMPCNCWRQGHGPAGDGEGSRACRGCLVREADGWLGRQSEGGGQLNQPVRGARCFCWRPVPVGKLPTLSELKLVTLDRGQMQNWDIHPEKRFKIRPRWHHERLYLKRDQGRGNREGNRRVLLHV